MGRIKLNGKAIFVLRVDEIGVLAQNSFGFRDEAVARRREKLRFQRQLLVRGLRRRVQRLQIAQILLEALAGRVQPFFDGGNG